MFKAYFELLYLLWMVDSLRTSKVHQRSIELVGDNREFDIKGLIALDER